MISGPYLISYSIDHGVNFWQTSTNKWSVSVDLYNIYLSYINFFFFIIYYILPISIHSFQMTLMGSFDWDGLVAIDRIMAQILCGTYFALAGVVCMNLYIALLSDTFCRVYAYAQANAVMQQAKTIILLENNLSKFHRSIYGHYMQEQCSPQVRPRGCSIL